MPSFEQCRKDLLQSFEQGAGGMAVSDEARAWLVKFCDGWMSNPPNSGGRSVPDLWDEENGGPPPTGQKLMSRFKKIGRVAAQSCQDAGHEEISDADVEMATQKVASEPASICDICPDV